VAIADGGNPRWRTAPPPTLRWRGGELPRRCACCGGRPLGRKVTLRRTVLLLSLRRRMTSRRETFAPARSLMGLWGSLRARAPNPQNQTSPFAPLSSRRDTHARGCQRSAGRSGGVKAVRVLADVRGHRRSLTGLLSSCSRVGIGLKAHSEHFRTTPKTCLRPEPRWACSRPPPRVVGGWSVQGRRKAMACRHEAA
jgi:hypothetical protein